MTHTAGRLSANNFNFKIFIVVLLTAFSAFIFSSCGEVEDISSTTNNTFQIESVLNALGADETETAKKFTVNADGEPMDIIYDDVSVKIKLEFENSKLFRVQYNFGTNTEAALKFANEVQKIFEQKWGESDTYETLPDRIKGLTADNYLSNDIMQYKEYWIDTGVDFSEIVPDEHKNSKRIDLGVGIKKFPADKITTVVYIGGIINSINTAKLPG